MGLRQFKGATQSSSGLSGQSLTFDNPVVAHSTIVAVLYCYTDSNTWVPAAGHITDNISSSYAMPLEVSPSDVFIGLWYAYNVAGGSSVQVGWTPNVGSNHFAGFAIFELDPLADYSDPLYATNSATPANSPASPGALESVQDDMFCVTGVTAQNGGISASTPPTDFTSSMSGNDGAIAHRIVPSPALVDPSWVLTEDAATLLTLHAMFYSEPIPPPTIILPKRGMFFGQ